MILHLVVGVVGLAAAVIGLAAIAEDHRESKFLHRLAIGVKVLLCLYVGLDSFAGASVDGHHVNGLAVAFTACLGVTWACRLRMLARQGRARHEN